MTTKAALEAAFSVAMELSAIDLEERSYLAAGLT
jgi:hypothetical protein